MKSANDSAPDSASGKDNQTAEDGEKTSAEPEKSAKPTAEGDECVKAEILLYLVTNPFYFNYFVFREKKATSTTKNGDAAGQESKGTCLLFNPFVIIIIMVYPRQVIYLSEMC